MRKSFTVFGAVVAVLVLVLAFGVGCAGPAYVAGKRVAPKSPDDVVHAEARMDTSDGLKLLVQSWKPQGESKGALVIVHGLKDYADRYADFAAACARRGYEVHALDLRGHGDSEGDRVFINRFDEYLGDLDLFMKRVSGEAKGKPVFLMGHSMGGAIVTLYTLTEKPKLAGLITSAGALQTDAPGGLVGAVKFFSVVAPRLAVFELNDADFSRDPKVVASMANDPLIFDGKGPARTASELLGAIARIHELGGKVNVPLLTLHGTVDKVTPPAGSAWLVSSASTTDKTEQKFEGLAHDLLHEPEAAKVVETILGWMDSHVAPPAAPAPAATP
ncbi:MAG: alpha/beta hydrolase [Myxococcaceae bacterium]